MYSVGDTVVLSNEEMVRIIGLTKEGYKVVCENGYEVLREYEIKESEVISKLPF